MKRENIVDIMSLYKTNIFHEDWTANTFELNSDGGDFTLPLKYQFLKEFWPRGGTV